jgi:glycerophosphoryl diester phosphodiesterase
MEKNPKMKVKIIWMLFLGLLVALVSCRKEGKVTTVHLEQTIGDDSKQIFDLQGHRGARGLMPENSIPAFIKAIDLGVTTLEMDVVVSRDKKMVVSHEPYFSHKICRSSSGDSIYPVWEKEAYNIYKHTAYEIRQFDCGSMKNPDFPHQKKIRTYKPTLKEVVDSVEAYIHKKQLPAIFYNIETKTSPQTDSLFHPKPEEFVRLLYDELIELNIIEKVYIQSFDVRTLQAFKQLDEEIPLVLLVENTLPLAENLQYLGFTPSVYSPFFQRLNKEEVKKAHELGMRVIPWTVNDEKDMQKMIQMGVDGLITDYPNRYKQMLRKKGKH